jgi:hypothetical protein
MHTMAIVNSGNAGTLRWWLRQCDENCAGALLFHPPDSLRKGEIGEEGGEEGREGGREGGRRGREGGREGRREGEKGNPAVERSWDKDG